MKKEAKYNAKTQTATFPRAVHYSELSKGSKVINDSPPAAEQKLSAKEGNEGAKRLLMSRYK